MGLGLCIATLIDEGKIPLAKAKGIKRRYEAMVARSEGEMGRVAAEAEASGALLKMLEIEAHEGARRKGLQARSQQNWLAERRAIDGDGPLSAKAMKRELELTEYKVDTVFGHMLIGFDGFIARHRRNIVGQVRERAELEDIVRARFGEKVESATAREVAEAMGETMDAARLRRNRAGGNTAKLDGFGLPQSHDSALVRAVPFEEWRARPEVERAKVRDPDAGEWAEGARREEILQASYSNIRSDGAESMTPGGMGQGSMARRRQEARVIHFANGDDWLSYARDFGGGTNAYDIFLGHMKAMAREIVLMEDMGPNPAASLRFRQDWLEQSIKTAPPVKETLGQKMLGIGGIGGLKAQRSALQRRFDVISGVANIPDNEKWARRMSMLRSQQMAAKLGSAVASAVPGDLATLIHRAGYNRLPAVRMLGSYAKMTAEFGGLSDRQAARLGQVSEEWLGLHSAAWRQGGEELTGEVARVLADATLRGSGMSRHTRLAQWAFEKETLGYLTEERGARFDELPEAIQRMMGKYDIAAPIWDAFRASDLIEDGGVEWLVPAYAGEAGEKIGVMLRNERDFAVLMPDLRTRALLAQFKAGSPLGEGLRSVLLFKSFPISMLSRHIPEMMAQRGLWNRALYGVSLSAVLTAGGLLTLWAKDIINGKDPRAVWGEDGPDVGTLKQAYFQGGGGGVPADLIKSSETRTGGGPLATAAGPLLALGFDLGIAGVSNASKALDGDPETESQAGKDFARIGLREVPGMSLWYARLAYDRIFADWVMGQVNPDRDQQIAAALRRANEQGTSYYAPPGSGFPGERMPDFGNAVGVPAAPENVARQEAEALEKEAQ